MSVESVFNHLVLPPKLPGSQDIDIVSIQQSILNRLIRACDTLRKLTSQELMETWTSVRHSLLVCLNVNAGRLEKASLLQELSNLQQRGFLILHVVEQNAALLIRRDVNDGVNTVIFEAFEASPSTENVLAAENALQWELPGRAVQIPLEEFLKESFRESLATFLEGASMETLTRFGARSAKAKVSVTEPRDTANPALVTQMLMPLLEAIGSSINVPRLRKRVRDDVSIQNAEFPWRRLPFWLILRVATQRQLFLAHGDETGRACYKFLICTVLAQLLADCTGQLTPELTMMLRAKLCRRLAKLEMDKASVSSASSIYKQLFGSISPLCKDIIEKATQQVESAWATLKRGITRHVPKLPSHADEQALQLSLPNSGSYLRNLLNLSHTQRSHSASLHLSLSGDSVREQVGMFADRYFKLARLECKIEAERTSAPEALEDHQTRCIKLAQSIINYFTAVGNDYGSNTEQMSIFILNLIDLWVQMDESAVKACPLLADYHPVFRPELLDVLQISTLPGMQRLQDIQRHLRDRCRNCRFPHKTIFSEPNKDCFAARFLENSAQLCALELQIENASKTSHEKKELEWKRACEDYDELSQKISEGTCVCSIKPDGSRNVRGCQKCWHWRCRKKMKISVHEDFLPEDRFQKAAVVFELGISSYLAVYRNITWRLITDLGHPSKPGTSSQPAMLLKDYHQLQRFGTLTASGISLASVKKSFLQTHYGALKMKVNLLQICSPLALQFQYYDIGSGIWLKSLDKPLTFQHLCGIHVPRGLEVSVMPSMVHPAPSVDGPSSYQIVASQTNCPSNMSIHEFMSYQRLLAGKARRWPTILAELGASNLNFSSEDTMHVFSQLAVQAGPAHNESDLFRDAHFFLRDQSFCQRLTEQIGNRLRNISSNWREVHCMEMLIALSLRIFNLSPSSDRQSAETLLRTARESTLSWISRLRNEVRNAAEADTARRAAEYGFWAALLCRRTFTIFIGLDSIINAEDLCTFIQASVALQENLVVDLMTLPQNTKNKLVRDMKMAYQIQLIIKQSIESSPESLGAAINKTWSDPSNFIGRTYSSWRFLASPNEKWVTSNTTVMVNEFLVTQVIHYNYVEGNLLVDGKPLGRLPVDIRESEEVKELFGNQNFLTFPSPLTGMSHVMATRIRGHEIHFGLRGKSVIVRAVTAYGLLEYVSRSVFMNNNSFDLPLPLIDDCIHWFNFRSKCLEIRRKPAIWRTRPNDWVIDVLKRRAQRSRVFLVDPHSDLCRRVAGIFRHFEDAQRLTVFQPIFSKGNLSIELRHLELSFFVSRSGLLQCRELNAEIDPNQDAGTLYGLESKMVLRDVTNVERRSIITPLGKLTAKRHGIHVAVHIRNTGEYGRFEIDDVLGRLSCPPEPRLIYSKAQFHAFTSFVLPDPLTQRTGAEEALYILRSGYCQPWMPMVDSVVSILESIQRLSPVREYYPREKRRLQTVMWDQDLTASIQHDSYELLAQEILAKSDRLRAFAVQNIKDPNCYLEVSSHLRRRGESRRVLYERSICNSGTPSTREDMIYEPRDRQANSIEATNVYQVVRLIRKQPFSFHMTRDLATILHSWNLIGGFHNTEGVTPCLSDSIENNISNQWGSLVNFCRQTNPQDHYRMIFRLGLLSFGTNPDMNAIQSLAAFGCLDELKAIQTPSCPSFTKFKLHASPTLESLLNIILIECPIFEPNPDQTKKQQNLARAKHKVLCEAEGESLARFLLGQWPSQEPSGEGFESTLINVKMALKRILPEFQRLYQNMELSQYVVRAQEILDRHKGVKDTVTPRAWKAKPTAVCAPKRSPVVPSSFGDLLGICRPLIWDTLSSDHKMISSNDLLGGLNLHMELTDISYTTTLSKEAVELEKILSTFIESPNFLRQQYGNDLKKSLDALENVSCQQEFQEMLPSINIVKEAIEKARAALEYHIDTIRNACSVEDDRFKWLRLSSLWPCIAPMTILEQLRSNFYHKLQINIREFLAFYGVLVTTLQRLLRIKDARVRGDRRKVLEEFRNTGHEDWSPIDFPDWLLLEIDGNLLIRREQVEVARAVISPASGSNSVLQMNMGKGKTSCIVPMAAAILANKKQLLRLIVPKALLLQTAQTMQSRLGGLVGREIRHVPFSRRTMTTPNMLQLYSKLHRDILCSCGVMLTTPEHILSYKLSGLQRLADLRLKEAEEMIGFQSWLTNTCRDVLDESDFTLAVKTQLIYPNGPQLSVDGHPHRWEVAQILLSLIEDHLPNLQRNFPQSIEVAERQHGFPMIHFLQTDVEDALHYQITNDICDGRTSFLRLANSTSSINKGEIKRVLSEESINRQLIKRVSLLFVDQSSAYKNIILVRGLLLNRILLLCLKKRWNVQYGLHPKRQPIAVPFEAKGVPSEQAEFGHPDVAILFTCLAFYYSGLNLSQFSEDLHHVLRSDDPATEYDRWTCTSNTLPEALHHWNVINVDDQGQVETLWRHLRLNRNVLDHYMNNFVFPIHAKQFGIKMQASGWDIPLFARSQREGETSWARTTGFSGTNDNKLMLPLTINQDDLPGLRQTNAEVLTYLLQDRNRQYNIASSQGRRLTEEGLLSRISSMGIRILIDAGAYILEMDNQTLVKTWLTIDPKSKGAIYFDADNRAWVQYRGGKKKVPLLATPFAENLDECLVYLDEAHTRGIDLKLPQNARGALTLALNQTKDHTVQASMRLRQLGSTQSIAFFAPPEVHQSITYNCKKICKETIDSSHVIKWLLEQTCRANEQLQNLYFAQGTDFCRRTNAQWENAKFLADVGHRDAFLNVIQHRDLQTLEQLYGGMADNQSSSLINLSSPELKGFVEKLSKQRRAAEGNGIVIHHSALEEVEQEREVEFQMEEIRQVQKPMRYKALAFPGLHAAISHFAKTGSLTGGCGYRQAFEALACTAIGQKFNVGCTESRLFVSSEFTRTINCGQDGSNDNFLRPVEWILWSPSNETALIIISEEAELLIPIIRIDKQPKVHLIVYAAPVTKFMMHFNGLSYYVLPRLPFGYTMPNWLSLELGIFAGRLYFYFSEVDTLREYLQLTDNTGTGARQSITKRVGGFTKNPIDFLWEWLTLCRKGQDITHTPMGYICQRRPLHKSHPFFIAQSADTVDVVAPSVEGTINENAEESEDGDTDEDQWTH